jgi:hypothetical protein
LESLSRFAAMVSSAILALAGILVLAGSGAASATAIVGAGLSLLLVLATFHPWFLAAVAIDVSILVIALS